MASTPQMTDIATQIWDMKYRLKAPDGAPIDQDVAQSWARVALALAAAEEPGDQAAHAHAFAAALAGYRFLPAGRILAGAGTGRAVTLFNCFVMGAIPDSMDGIFSALREAALTLQQGGGIGYDFSTLRPKGAGVKGVGADASGPVSFMEVWDAMCRTIMSAGSRRGAMMATLACDHPDIEDFIAAKRTPGRLTNFNLSVLVSDAFMAAVKDDADWALQFGGTVYRTLKLLTECGVAFERKFGDGLTRYELADETHHHDHLICVDCGKIIEFEEPKIEELQEKIAARYGFVLKTHKHEMYGSCADCQAKANRSTRRN